MHKIKEVMVVEERQQNLIKSAEFAGYVYEELVDWRPDMDLNQLMECLRNQRYHLSFSNMFGAVEAEISVYNLSQGATIEAKGTGANEAAAGFAALCELMQLLQAT